MATLNDEIYVKIVADNTKAVKAMKELAGNIQVAAGAAIAFATKLVAAFADAEKSSLQFAFALKQNPFLSSSSISRLDSFATSLSKLTGVDDDLIKSQIAITSTFGLTEDQMKDVMKAAANLAATGVMPLDNAVQTLAASYEGTAGRLGRYVKGVKDLTEDQLRAGDAVKLVNENLKGTAEALAGGTQVAMDNFKVSVGNLAEAGGRVMSMFFNPFLRTVGPLIDRISKFIGETFDLNAAQNATFAGTATPEQLITVLNAALKENGKQIEDVAKKQQVMVEGFGEGIMSSSGFKALQDQLVALQDVRKEMQERLKYLNDSAEAEDKAAKAAAAHAASLVAQLQALKDISANVRYADYYPGGVMPGAIPAAGPKDVTGTQGISNISWEQLTPQKDALVAYNEKLATTTALFTQIGDIAKSIGSDLAKGDIAGAFAKAADAALGALIGFATAAAAKAYVLGDPTWVMWAGLAGLGILGEVGIGALGSSSSTGPTGASTLPHDVPKSLTINVQGSVITERNLARTVGAAMGNW